MRCLLRRCSDGYRQVGLQTLRMYRPGDPQAKWSWLPAAGPAGARELVLPLLGPGPVRPDTAGAPRRLPVTGGGTAGTSGVPGAQPAGAGPVGLDGGPMAAALAVHVYHYPADDAPVTHRLRRAVPRP